MLAQAVERLTKIVRVTPKEVGGLGAKALFRFAVTVLLSGRLPRDRHPRVFRGSPLSRALGLA
jgi:hypothetical protein